jgi:hypothetical protein
MGGKKFWEELVTPTFLQIYQSKNIYSDSQKLKINAREKNVYFLAPTAAVFFARNASNRQDIP